MDRVKVVKNALFCLMDRYQNVCVWFMARNCRVPKVGTHCCQRGKPQVAIARNCRFPEVGTHGSKPGNKRLPLQATAGSHLGTTGYHCKELPVPKGWNWWFPTWEPKVTMARNCRFPDLETYGSQPGNQRLPLQGIAGSQKLEFHVVRNCGFHCKELPDSLETHGFQAWKSNVTSGRSSCWFQKVKTHGS